MAGREAVPHFGSLLSDLLGKGGWDQLIRNGRVHHSQFELSLGFAIVSYSLVSCSDLLSHGLGAVLLMMLQV